MQVILELIIVLTLTRVLGELAERASLPPAVGEMFAGIVLAGAIALIGPQIPVLAGLPDSDTLRQTANLGIFFLILMAGVETRPADMVRNSRAAVGVALGGMILPLAIGIGLGFAFLAPGETRLVQAFLIGVAISITAIAATAKVFADFGLLRAKPGRLLVSASVFDDVLGLFLLAVLIAMIETGTLPDIADFALLLLKIGVFFAVTGLIGVHVYPRVTRKMQEMKAVAIEFSALVATALAYSLLAEVLGLHWVLGPFMAGLFFESSRVGERPYQDMRLMLNAIAGGVLGPLFFAWIGLKVDLRVVTEVPMFLILLITAAIAGKYVGAGLPARLAGYSRRDSTLVGIGMCARGEIEIVVISIALEAGLISRVGVADPVSRYLFSALVLMAVVTTFVTPILLRLALRGHAPPDRE